ncbi:MAG: 3'-5' exoribonuclease [Gallionella sp.]|jgi:hypothetical protein
MLIFFDTEFTELGMDPRLISIGLVAEDGISTFYAELSDTYLPYNCSDFVKDEVLPHLQRGEYLMTMSELSLQLGNWIESFECPVSLITDSLDWDWPYIRELFRLPGTWPANLSRSPETMRDIQEIEDVVDAVFESHRPKLRRHHAVDDARANWVGWRVAA